MNLELKKVKTWTGRDGLGCQGELFVDGKPAIRFHDDGNGGEMFFDVFNADLMTRLQEHVKTLPAEEVNIGSDDKPHMFTTQPSLERLVAQLLDQRDHDKWLKRHCQTKTLFRLPGDKEGAYRNMKAPYSAAVKAQIIKTYGNDVEIINERFQ
jgi:hypothetical protein